MRSIWVVEDSSGVPLTNQKKAGQIISKHLDPCSVCGSLLKRAYLTVNPVETIDIVEEPLDNPIHMLYSDDDLERKISAYFRRAFGQDLVLDRGAGKIWPMRVGTRLSSDCGDNPFSTSFLSCQRDSTLPLSQQGDGMRSFASVVLHLLAPASPSILLLDEPEAFLHPPQARLLGEIIATEKSPRAQLFWLPTVRMCFKA